MIKAATTAIMALMLATTPTMAQDAHQWDGLLRVKSKHIDAVYLLPQADFRSYTKVMIDPTEVAFRKNWRRDLNNDTLDMQNRISDADARKILDEAKSGFDKIMREAYEKAGYQIVTTPGPDVLRIATAIVNLDVEAPDTMSPGISRTYSKEAGEATLVIEARDSLSGAVLGRAADADSTGDFGPYLRNRATNAGEFEDLFRRWAKLSAEGLGELKALSPIDTSGKLAKH